MLIIYYILVTTKKIELPTGSYEVTDISTYINDYLEKKYENIKIDIKANNNTLKSEIFSNVIIDFEKPNSLASILGFEKCKSDPNILYIQFYTANMYCKSGNCSNCL